MKNLAVKQLDERDEEFAETLINLGMRRYVARTLAYLRNVNEAKETLRREPACTSQKLALQ